MSLKPLGDRVLIKPEAAEQKTASGLYIASNAEFSESVRSDELSGGQQQRVSIARALVQRADIILADEPVASLDPVTTQTVLKDLERINKEEGKTVVVNIHSVELARQFSTRIIALRAGRLVFDGTPDELTEERLAEIYDKDAAEREAKGAAA